MLKFKPLNLDLEKEFHKSNLINCSGSGSEVSHICLLGHLDKPQRICI